MRRIGFIGIIIEDRKRAASKVNDILSQYGDVIIARTGIPYREYGCGIITLIVHLTNEELGALTGKLGNIEGVSVKSALSKSYYE